MAIKRGDIVLARFRDPAGGFFSTAAGHDALVVRRKEPGEFPKNAVDLLRHPAIERALIVFLERARLSGIDFKLFDPRALYPDADRLSFVFLDANEAPFLDGRLVQVARGETRTRHDAELIRAASFYLSAPNIQLRGYLEDWADLLLSWVKYFFVEDLAWRRREEMQGYEDYRDIFLDVETTLGRARAEQATFDAIVATFAQHAEHWSKEVAAGAEV